MAKKSAFDKNQKRIAAVKKASDKRYALRNKIKDKNLPMEERWELVQKLAKQPRDESSSRIRRRCDETGRPRGNYRFFQLSRIRFRDRASKGELPGVRKASW